jgi:pSer/pThr/pTyr-binding forkhead associated (FHA) protein
MPAFVKILASPKTEQVGMKIALREGENIFGRMNPPCQIALDGKKVSKKHGSFFVDDQTIFVLDHNSANGIYVNGKKITKQDLRDRDRLVVGEFTLEISVS